MDEIINKVEQKNLEVFDLSDYFPKEEIVDWDMSHFLEQGLLLREKDFRAKCKDFAWDQFKGKHLCVYCSTDAILPAWANMLIARHAAPFAETITYGRKAAFLTLYYQQTLSDLNLSKYEGQRVIIKGCSNVPVPEQAYIEASRRLSGVVKRLSFGEACSQVPL